MNKEIPDFYFEQALLDELPPEKREEVSASPEGEQRLEEMQKSNNEILKTYDFSQFAKNTEQRLNNNEHQEEDNIISLNRKKKFYPPKAFSLLAAAAIIVAIFLPMTFNSTTSGYDENEIEGIRLKGLTPTLKIYRKSGESVELLSEKQTVEESDLLQMSYQAAGKKYGTIFSIDGNGYVTLHYPDSPSGSLELTAGGEIPLNFAYQLDDAPGYERFFFITSNSYFSITQILDEAAQMADSFYEARDGELEIPEVCDTKSILLLKGDTHE